MRVVDPANSRVAAVVVDLDGGGERLSEAIFEADLAVGPQGQTLVGVGAVFEGLIAFMQARAKAENPIEPSLMEMMLTNVGIPGWKEAVEGYESSGERADAMLKAISDAYSEAEAQ